MNSIDAKFCVYTENHGSHSQTPVWECSVSETPFRIIENETEFRTTFPSQTVRRGELGRSRIEKLILSLRGVPDEVGGGVFERTPTVPDKSGFDNL